MRLLLLTRRSPGTHTHQIVLFHTALVQTGELDEAFVTYEELESKRPLKGDRHKIRDQSTEELELQVISSPLGNGHGHKEEHQGLLREGHGKPHGDVAATGAALKSMELDLRTYVNRSGVCVPHHFSAMRAFIMFRTLGLRHLPVVDEHNHVVGIVTRKELLDESLGEKLAALGIHVHH